MGSNPVGGTIKKGKLMTKEHETWSLKLVQKGMDIGNDIMDDIEDEDLNLEAKTILCRAIIIQLIGSMMTNVAFKMRERAEDIKKEHLEETKRTIEAAYNYGTEIFKERTN